MSSSDEIRDYVRRALEAGQGRDEIRAALERAGWSAPQIDRALGAWADVPGPIPVPRPRATLSAREALVYLVLFAALYMTAWHLGSLVFDLIDTAIPDPADRDYGLTRSIHWSIAALIVAVPLFLWMSRLANREIAADPVRRHSPVRQWLGHITLFLAALFIVGALVTAIFSLLQGELTLRFLLKALTVCTIAAAVFLYYRSDLAPDRRE